jgi:hypothetical protein
LRAAPVGMRFRIVGGRRDLCVVPVRALR